MKKLEILITLAVLLFCFSLSLAEERVVDFTKLQNRNGLMYEMNTQVPFSGISLISKYDSGQWENLIRFKDGKSIGGELYYENGQYKYKSENIGKFRYEEYFYPDGVIKHKKQFKERAPNGVWVWFDRKGNTKKEIAYQMLDGSYRLLDENLNVYSEVNYKNGKLDGKSLKYDDGNISDETEYRTGKAHGISKSFYTFGNLGLWYIVKYIDGKKQGVEVSYDYQGTLHKVGKYKKGDKDGLWVEWKYGAIDNTDVILIEKYDLGEIIERQCFDKKEVSCKSLSSDKRALDKKYKNQIETLQFLYGKQPDRTLADDLLSMIDDNGKLIPTNKILKKRKVIEEENAEMERQNAEEIALKAKLDENREKFQTEFKKKVLEKINNNWNIVSFSGIKNYEKYIIVLELSLDPKGKIKEITTVFPEKVEGTFLIAERAAKSAIARSVPFTISEELFPEGLKLRMVFDPKT